MAKTNPTIPGMSAAIDARRQMRDLSLDDFARLSGLSRQGLMPVRRGTDKPYQERLLRGVAVALKWPADWLERLRVGDDWREFPDTDWPAIRSVEDRLTDLEARFEAIADALERLAAQQAAQ